jgi:hypothetical protein
MTSTTITSTSPTAAQRRALLPLPSSGTPTVAVIAKRILSDGALAVTLRPNGDPIGDSVHTLYVTPKLTAADITAWLAARQADVAAQYAALHAAHAAIATLGT